MLSQHVSHGFPRCLVSSWTCHTAASPWVCCQWSCERTAALVSQSSQSGGTAAEVKVSQTFMDNNKEEGSLCIYSGFYLNNFKYSKCFVFFCFFFMFEDFCSVSQSCSRLTWRFGWGKPNGCADGATPVTGPEDFPPALGLWGCVSLQVKQLTLLTLSV